MLRMSSGKPFVARQSADKSYDRGCSAECPTARGLRLAPARSADIDAVAASLAQHEQFAAGASRERQRLGAKALAVAQHHVRARAAIRSAASKIQRLNPRIVQA